MKLAIALIGAVSLAASTPALAAEKPAGKCFDVKDIKGHVIADDRTLYLNVGGQSVYRVGMSNNCLGGMAPSDPVTLTGRGAPKICEASDLDVHAEVNGGGLSSRCVIDTLTKLTPAQASALPAKLKP
ncbi:hypothetical protein [Phenylobacterium sp.]|uniref:hypothetical protein n=1 Tax=Phenylobacterium sp. TaxID=1871053 RepID=UPI002CC7270F|nr:hypothetical protein [Phenylobacterium sp.]HLZ75093.1 hypothetical protein [Phenylobacterium sp.]